MKFIPKEYQNLIIDWQLDLARSTTWAGMGMGKTSSTLTTIEARQLAGMGRALVIAPKRVAQSTWPDEVAKWDHLSGMEIRPIIGTVAQRKQALLDKNAGVFTINYENIPWLMDTLKAWPFEMIVCDESRRLGNFRLRKGGQRARALGRAAKRPAYWVNLTATPAPSGYLDLWGQQWFIDFGEALGLTYSAFKERYFMVANPYADYPDWISAPFAEEQIRDHLRSTCLTVRPEDYFNLEEPIRNRIYVDLPDKADRLYRQMEREEYIELGPESAEALNAGAVSNKCGQIASGGVYVDAQGNFADTDADGRPAKEAKRWIEIHDAKLQALESIISESGGEPILVAYHYKPNRERILRAFPKARELDDNPQTIRDWNAGKIPILVAHPMSAGHGLNLQDGGRIIVFFDIDWNLEGHDQIIERLGPMRQLQAGYNRSVFIHYILARNTVDERKMKRLYDRRKVQDILLEAMTRR